MPDSPNPPTASFCYVYTLQSEPCPDRFYVGHTDDLGGRLALHNSGSVRHTSKFRPWGIKTAIAFRSRERAVQFELYLKSHSGRAFARKHF